MTHRKLAAQASNLSLQLALLARIHPAVLFQWIALLT
jgi:hypothetical protein